MSYDPYDDEVRRQVSMHPDYYEEKSREEDSSYSSSSWDRDDDDYRDVNDWDD